MNQPESVNRSVELKKGEVPRPAGIINGSGRFRVPPIFGTNFDGPFRNTDPVDRSQSK